MANLISRLRRAKRTRAHIRSLGSTRMSVHRTLNHIYVQVTSPDATVLAQASSLDKEIAGEIKSGGNVDAAKLVGELIAKRCLEKNINRV